MVQPSRPWLVFTILIACGLLLALPTWQTWRARPPDFTLYPAGELRKTAFFNFLGPIIDSQNEIRQQQRERLLDLRNHEWQKSDRLWILDLAKTFELTHVLSEAQLIDALLSHVDTVPRSLALAQAAKESAWGTSRFAVTGNNYFGQRCYIKGCGLVPESRARGEKFEVRRFDSVEASVASYMNNINGHREYQALRDYRAERRRQGKRVTGIQAAERITQYSERRQAYVDEIQSLIHFNKLDVP